MNLAISFAVLSFSAISNLTSSAGLAELRKKLYSGSEAANITCRFFIISSRQPISLYFIGLDLQWLKPFFLPQ
jgi:hypothetical protein